MYIKRRRKHIIIKLIQNLFAKHIVRYALVGGIGIPVNELALALFLWLLGSNLYPIAMVLSFEVSTTVNFILNQTFTYREQRQGIHGWGWVRRAIKAQVTSLSAMGVTFVVALSLKYGFNVSPYLANLVGIIVAFFFNYAISRRFVFRPTQSPVSVTGEVVNAEAAIADSLVGDAVLNASGSEA